SFFGSKGSGLIGQPPAAGAWASSSGRSIETAAPANAVVRSLRRFIHSSLSLDVLTRDPFHTFFSNGSSTRKIAPVPSALLTVTLPLYAVQIDFTIAKPSPVPPSCRDRALFMRKRRWKIWDVWSLGTRRLVSGTSRPTLPSC